MCSLTPQVPKHNYPNCYGFSLASRLDVPNCRHYGIILLNILPIWYDDNGDCWNGNGGQETFYGNGDETMAMVRDPKNPWEGHGDRKNSWGWNGDGDRLFYHLTIF